RREGEPPVVVLRVAGAGQPRGEELLAQPRGHEGTRARREALREGAEECPGEEEGPGDDGRRGRVLAADDGDDERGEGEGRPDGRDALRHTDRGEGGHGPAGGRDHVQDVWVEGLHADGASA